MNVQPYMIDVEYDETIERFDGAHAAIEQIVKSDPLKKDTDQYGRDIWYTYNHFHRQIKRTTGLKRQMLQIGFQLDHTEQADSEAAEVYLIPLHDEVDPILLDYDEEHNIWFEKIKYRISTDDKTKEQRLVRKPVKIAGIVDAGTIKLIVKRNDINVYEAYVHFLPSSLSIDDYELMLTDLFRINEKLFIGKSDVAIGNKKQRQIEQLEKTITELEGPIYAINNQPQTALTFEWQKEKYNRSTKFRMRTEIEKRMNPGKQKISVFTPYETPQIAENAMIKSELIRLKKYCEFYSSNSILKKADEEQIERERITTINSIDKGFKRQLQNEGVITNDKQINFAKLKRKKKIIQSEIKRHNDNINFEKVALADHIKEFMFISQEPQYRQLDFTVNVTLKEDLFQRNIALNNNQINSYYKSVYNEHTRASSIHFNHYSYERNGNFHPIQRPQSYFVTLKISSQNVMNHWKLAYAFKIARQKFIEHNKEVNIEVQATSYDNYPQINRDNENIHDIVGTLQYNKSSPYRNYQFNFNQITQILIDGTPVDFNASLTHASEFIAAEIVDGKDSTKFETMNSQINIIESLNKLHDAGENIDKHTKRYTKLAKKIDDWLHLPAFRTIQTSGLEQLQPTQLFLHDPTYLIVWNLMNQIEESTDLSLIPQFGELRYGVKKVHQIYETWTLYKIIDILTNEMGWKIENKLNAQQYFLNFISLRKNLKKFTITLTLNRWKIVIYYEPYIKLVQKSDHANKNGKNQSENYRPDYAFQFFHDDKHLGNAYIDAKYRNYIEQGTDKNIENIQKNAEQIWKRDIDKTAIKKYGNINAVSPEWKGDALASFIIHPDVTFGTSKHLSGENYHVYYNERLYPGMITGRPENVHKYGSIYMTPSAIYPFKNWIRMIMEFHFGAYDKCWTCGSENVEEQVKYTISNYPKFYYTCRNCTDTFWIKTHCRKGHTVIKYDNTYHKRADRNDHWHIVCPTCADQFEEREQQYPQQTTRNTRTNQGNYEATFDQGQPTEILMMEDELPF